MTGYPRLIGLGKLPGPSTTRAKFVCQRPNRMHPNYASGESLLSDRGFCLTAKPTYALLPLHTKIQNPSLLLRVCVYSQLSLEYNEATPNSKQLLFPRLPM